MAEKTAISKVSDLECCPDLERRPVCDTLNLRYRLPFRPRVGEDKRQVVPVEVVLHFRLERCSGPLVLGDPIYTTTLLPGEKVRLFTSDRHSRWSYDSETNLSYRHETTSEESFYTAGMAQAMSNLTINESGSSTSSYEESWAEGGGGLSVSIFGIIDIGGGGGGGSYDSSSMYSFSRSLSRHSEAASRYVAAGVRAKSSTTIGEVAQRKHAEGESEAHYESSSRVFSNPNKCSAVTYLFYKINKLQTVRFKLVAIERRVEDPVAPTGAYQRVPVDTTGRVEVLPQVIPATSKDRLEIEHMARTSATERRMADTKLGVVANTVAYSAALGYATAAREPIDIRLREAAIAAVDEDLVSAGILDAKTRKPADKYVAELSWEREEVLPTPGILVKGCRDQCDICEPALQKEIELELERKRLENKMLEREIELLDKAQEYRCCPDGEESDGAAEAPENNAGPSA
ncbi:MAG TPA: hypothetical protein ENJ43_00045 [Gammaproteobacteria bacterium]|nr:hypothetical protein [Gammaproteobacteria bacterium]